MNRVRNDCDLTRNRIDLLPASSTSGPLGPRLGGPHITVLRFGSVAVLFAALIDDFVALISIRIQRTREGPPTGWPNESGLADQQRNPGIPLFVLLITDGAFRPQTASMQACSIDVIGQVNNGKTSIP